MARVTLVYTNSLGIPYIDLGLAYLSAALKRDGHEVQLIDFTFGGTDSEAIERIRRFDPLLVGMTARTNEFERVVQFSRAVKDALGLPIYCGGIHTTVAPEDAIERGVFDGICRGEGEEVFCQLVRALENGEDHTHIPGFWFVHRGVEIRNPVTSLVQDLDDLPYYDVELFDYERYLRARDYQIDYISGRGCAFKCTFCVDHTMHDIFKGTGKYVRQRSVESAITELEAMVKRYPVRRFTFPDEMFNIVKKRLIEFCRVYRERINIPFECDLRADCCEEAIFEALASANCEKVNIGVECGDEELRSSLLGKRIKNEQIAQTFAMARRYGIQTLSYNIIGLPNETREQIWKTIELNREIRPDSIQCSIFTPYPGTHLYDYCKSNGLLKDEATRRDMYTKSYYTGVYLKYPDFTDLELKFMRATFAYHCYTERSWPKAVGMLAREAATPLYVQLGHRVPDVVNQAIFRLLWHNRALKFLAK